MVTVTCDFFFFLLAFAPGSAEGTAAPDRGEPTSPPFPATASEGGRLEISVTSVPAATAAVAPCSWINGGEAGTVEAVGSGTGERDDMELLER
jgi:hypothetical protein